MGLFLFKMKCQINPFRYSGYWYDNETGKYYLKARYYDSSIGRFLSKDPIAIRVGSKLSLNAYTYGNNNPIMFVDPNGTNPLLWVIGLVAPEALLAIGAVIAVVAIGYYTGKYFFSDSGSVDDGYSPPNDVSAGSGDVPEATSDASGESEGKGKDTLVPGPFAKDSVPARSKGRDFTKAETDKVTEIGKETGCHTCGTTDPGTKSGDFIKDHQPPNATVPDGTPQRLYPHCKSCSASQGGTLSQIVQNLKRLMDR